MHVAIIMHMNKDLFLTYLKSRRQPVAQLEGMAFLHSDFCEVAPLFYLHFLTDRATNVSHKREILWNWLTHPSARAIDRQHVVSLLSSLPGEQSLQIVELVSDLRLNGHRARALVLSFLLGHPQFVLFAATRKKRIVRLLKHSLGERTWSSVRRALAETSPEGETLLAREVLCYVQEDRRQSVLAALTFLAGLPLPEHVDEPLLKKSADARRNLELGQSLPLETLLGVRGNYHKEFPLQKVRHLSAPVQRSMHREGELTATYKELLTTHPQMLDEQTEHFQERLRLATQSLPRLEGRLAIVLDLSASMVSSGERLYHPAALALVMVRQLRDLVSEMTLIQVGGSESVLQHFSPAPEGASDLASALLEALRGQPDLVMILSDGYENRREGDVAQVVEGLMRLEIAVPIYQVTPLFTESENLERRCFSPAIPVVALADEQDIRELLAYIVLATASTPMTLQEIEQLQQILDREVAS